MYWHGCNYPWSAEGGAGGYGFDFGANLWGAHLGVSTRRAVVARDFDAMSALGFTCARWFLFCDGRAGILYDERGFPAGTAPHLFADLDAALEIARDAGMRLALVLFDHRWMFEGVRDTIADPVTGALLEARLPHGRARVWQSAAGRDAVFANLMEPLVRRYGLSGERADLAPQILAIEFMNEPDVVIEEWGRDLSPHVAWPLPFPVVAELIARLSDLVHRHSPALTTIGCARAHNLWAFDDARLGLDLLQVHACHDPDHPRLDADRVVLPVSALGLSHGVLIGELPGNVPESPPDGASPPARTLDQYLELALEGGYAGAWPWSFTGVDAYGRLPEAPLRRFAQRHPHLVHPRATGARPSS